MKFRSVGGAIDGPSCWEGAFRDGLDERVPIKSGAGERSRHLPARVVPTPWWQLSSTAGGVYAVRITPTDASACIDELQVAGAYKVPLRRLPLGCVV